MNACKNYESYKMLHYGRTDGSGGIDVNKTSESKECNIYHYWHFLNKGLKFQPNVCKRCHCLLMMSLTLSNITNLNINFADYSFIISGISMKEAIKLIQNIILTETCTTL